MAGGLVSIGMFLLRWSAEDSLQRFEDVARKTFTRQRDRASPLGKVIDLLMAYIDDGQYSPSAIESAFRLTGDSEIQMFNPLRNNTKVAVTTTTTDNSAPRLIINYNGGRRPETSGKALVTYGTTRG